MKSDDNIQTKLVRYCESVVEQTIQLDENGEPFFSTLLLMIKGRRYICENQNRGICVSDTSLRKAVVVNCSGDLRFIYRGFQSSKKRQFNPHGITTDSQSRILIADIHNKCIHIVGQFLCYFENCGLRGTITALCVDTKDNLFVANNSTERIQKIKYA